MLNISLSTKLKPASTHQLHFQQNHGHQSNVWQFSASHTPATDRHLPLRYQLALSRSIAKIIVTHKYLPSTGNTLILITQEFACAFLLHLTARLAFNCTFVRTTSMYAPCCMLLLCAFSTIIIIIFVYYRKRQINLNAGFP